MLPDFNDGTYPQAAEVADILDEYADVIDGALSEVPAQSGGVAYLPSHRALRACREAVEKLRHARDGLDQGGKFWALLGTNGSYHRSVDRVRWALENVREAKRTMDEHQGSEGVPVSNYLALLILTETVRVAEEDLCGMLWKPIMEISFPHDYHGD